MQAHRLLAGAVLLGVLAGTGCGGPAKVSGVVTLDGAPLPDVLVTFHPASEDARPACAVTDAAGEFALTTREPGDGVVPGEYRVTVAVVETVPEGKTLAEFDAMIREDRRPVRKGSQPSLHGNYGHIEATPFRVTVPIKGKLELPLNRHGT